MKPEIKLEPYARQVLDGPILVAETQIETVVAHMTELANHKHFPELTAKVGSLESDEDYWALEEDRANCRPYNVHEGTLIIPVRGALIHRMGYQFGNVATGYEYIERAVNRGMVDPQVNRVMFHIDSPGGQAAGNFELVEHIASFRGKKPMIAMVEDKALSGGYSIASAADEIVLSSSGHTGSVGVIVVHVSFGEALKNFGVEVTFIKAGDRKTDGNPFESLSDTARARIQTGVDKFYGTFVSTVAKNRRMSDYDVRNTEADVYDAEESIEVGFADRIGDFRTELASLEAATLRGIPMSKEIDTPADDAAQIASDARAAERTRFSTVLASEHYVSREDLANHLLSTTEMSADQIVAALAVSPKAEKASEPAPTATREKRDHFAERMADEGTPGVQADDTGEPEQTPADVASTILADYKAAGGRVRAH